MTCIKTESIEAGMILGQDVVGSGGQILLRAGAKLSDAHLRVLASRNIVEVHVREPSSASEETKLDDTEVEALVSERFAKVDPGNPLISELVTLCRSRFG